MLADVATVTIYWEKYRAEAGFFALYLTKSRIAR